MRSPNWGRYEEHEVQALVDHYLELRFLKHRPSLHVRLMDLEVAMGHLPQKLFEAMLVYGLLRFTTQAAGEALSISETAVRKRYRQGLEQIIDYLNGDW